MVPRAARVVELKFFGGMGHSEIAEALNISVATVKREWNLARAWLFSGGGSIAYRLTFPARRLAAGTPADRRVGSAGKRKSFPVCQSAHP